MLGRWNFQLGWPMFGGLNFGVVYISILKSYARCQPYCSSVSSGASMPGAWITCGYWQHRGLPPNGKPLWMALQMGKWGYFTGKWGYFTGKWGYFTLLIGVVTIPTITPFVLLGFGRANLAWTIWEFGFTHESLPTKTEFEICSGEKSLDSLSQYANKNLPKIH